MLLQHSNDIRMAFVFGPAQRCPSELGIDHSGIHGVIQQKLDQLQISSPGGLMQGGTSMWATRRYQAIPSCPMLEQEDSAFLLPTYTGKEQRFLAELGVNARSE